VAALAEKEAPPAIGYAKMAEDTIRFGSDPDAISKINAAGGKGIDLQKPWRSMVGDALAGVDAGEKKDPRAADWKSLREQLQKLQPPKPPEDRKQKSSKKEQEQKKDAKKDKNSGQDKKDSQGGKEDQDQ